MNNIGLKRGSVKLLPHNKAWVIAFNREKGKLNKILGDKIIDIKHIGSTSIPTIVAKPIIDILVGVNSVQNPTKYIKILENAGYIFRINTKRPKNHLVFVKGNEQKHTHHIHLVKYNGAVWKRDLLFKKYLATHQKHAKLYSELKKKLAVQFPDDRKNYTLGKKNFIHKSLKIAQNE